MNTKEIAVVAGLVCGSAALTQWWESKRYLQYVENCQIAQPRPQCVAQGALVFGRLTAFMAEVY